MRSYLCELDAGDAVAASVLAAGAGSGSGGVAGFGSSLGTGAGADSGFGWVSGLGSSLGAGAVRASAPVRAASTGLGAGRIGLLRCLRFGFPLEQGRFGLRCR